MIRQNTNKSIIYIIYIWFKILLLVFSGIESLKYFVSIILILKMFNKNYAQLYKQHTTV